MQQSKSWVWFKCKLCNTFLPTKERIWAHLWTKHSTVNINTTLNKKQIPDVGQDWEVVTDIKPPSQVSVKVERRNIKMGQKVNLDKRIFKCHQCQKTFDKSQQLSNHRTRSKIKGCWIGRKKKIKKEKLFECPVCETDFKNRKSLLVHKFDSRHEPDLEAQSNYTCPHGGCGLNFRTLKTLEVHKCRHDARWEEMSKSERNKFKVDRVIGIVAQVYACPLCPAKMVFKWTLPRHLLKHAKDKPLKCGKCQTTYKTESMLKKHLEGDKKCERKLMEMETNRFECDICKKFLKSEKYLRYHKSRFHGIIVKKKKDYTCLFCGYVAADPSHLQQHNRTHTGERPFECEACFKSFTASHNLMRHKRGHCKASKLLDIPATAAIQPRPRMTIRKPGKVKVGDPLHIEKCPHCPQSFSRSRHMNQHIQVHGTNFFCTECVVGEQVGFIHLDALSRHYEIVHGKSDWGIRCHICRKMLCGNVGMKNHYLKVHGHESKEMKDLVEFAKQKGTLRLDPNPINSDPDNLHPNDNPIDRDQLDFPLADGGLENERDGFHLQDYVIYPDSVTPIVVKYEDEF